MYVLLGLPERIKWWQTVNENCVCSYCVCQACTVVNFINAYWVKDKEVAVSVQNRFFLSTPLLSRRELCFPYTDAWWVTTACMGPFQFHYLDLETCYSFCLSGINFNLRVVSCDFINVILLLVLAYSELHILGTVI